MEPLYWTTITLPEPLLKRKFAQNGEKIDLMRTEKEQQFCVGAGGVGQSGRTDRMSMTADERAPTCQKIVKDRRQVN